jgi:hypothetical protein
LIIESAQGCDRIGDLEFQRNWCERCMCRASSRGSRRTVLRGVLADNAAVLSARAGSSLTAPGDKVSLCHLTGNGSYPSSNVSENAVGKQLARWDAGCTEGE